MAKHFHWVNKELPFCVKGRDSSRAIR